MVAVVLLEIGFCSVGIAPLVWVRVVMACLSGGVRTPSLPNSVRLFRDSNLPLLDCLGRSDVKDGDTVGRRSTEAASRAPVNRERTLEVALALADSEGIEAVTMRRLARELGVEAASLYHHVKGKEQILDGLVELVAAEIELPKPSADWRETVSHRAHPPREG